MIPEGWNRNERGNPNGGGGRLNGKKISQAGWESVGPGELSTTSVGNKIGYLRSLRKGAVWPSGTLG